jgi:threonine synthase
MGVLTSLNGIGPDGLPYDCEYPYGPDLLPSGEWQGQTMWRYRALLPIDDGETLYPLPAGGTPLIAPRRLRAHLGLPDLWLKDETRSPTGSNKDRGTALVLEQALRSGANTVCCASTGNVAVSLAVGAAAAGLEAVVFVPADVAATKLDLMLFVGARVVRVKQGYEAAFELSRRAAQNWGWLDRNTGVNPATVEAKKTAAFEIWEQLGRQFPDVMLVPAGDGVTLCALAKGFRELQRCGVADAMPRIIGVQATGCEPIKVAWERNAPLLPVVPRTIADGIAVGSPLFGIRAVQDVRSSGGAFVSVTDDSIRSAASLLGRYAGLIAEPAGAAATAGLSAALETRLVTRKDRIVVHVTGSGLKMPQFLRAAEIPPEIDASLEALDRQLAATPQA